MKRFPTGSIVWWWLIPDGLWVHERFLESTVVPWLDRRWRDARPFVGDAWDDVAEDGFGCTCLEICLDPVGGSSFLLLAGFEFGVDSGVGAGG